MNTLINVTFGIIVAIFIFIIGSVIADKIEHIKAKR